MRYALIVVFMLLGPVGSAIAQVRVGIGFPGVNIGINLSLYPELVRVPGYPVYYAPQLDSNFFFYDGLYWVYQDDNWYASSWYNGPWGLVAPEVVPLFVLRIPVGYYRNPPRYFRGWRSDASPHWGEHWGDEWQQRRSGWDRWNRNAVPAPAPLPVYQRQFSGNRYPQQEKQRDLHGQNYRYQPRDAVVRKHYQKQAEQRAPEPEPKQRQQGRSQDISPRSQQPQRGEDTQRSRPGQAPSQPQGAAVQERQQEPRQSPVQREQQTPRSTQEKGPQGKGESQEHARGKGQDKDRDRGEERGQDRNR